ncbi:hypothetical protein BU25DRAFT_210277 [Macroventuria anomochaeta]|uniref:Uncharacterized protein n=1 Tax=Macroventuria anomochaeta TaxID=301207 RepID=A0ACB6RMZ0_9PLEO|nr:uncharacterized protein BU25DRAFT_210277 [Macroventuria anomochaeta]KAF2622529.1 hypothetical protein BU25DRAFT_210277 [Macroventuria anomochaeta]
MTTYNSRSFTQSKALTGKSSAIATLMTHILASYPLMMYTPNSSPPFIRPYSLSQHPHTQSHGFESLTTCASLMQMLSSRAPGGRKLFWKNVGLECERLQVELVAFDK